MILGRLVPANKIEIWSPRYKDRTILIAKHKVSHHNEIVFTKAKHLMDRTWYLSGETIRKHPIDTNGKIDVYAVSIDSLEPLERERS